jgi:hypothetical protein
MKQRLRKLFLPLTILSLITLFYACQKDGSLTDAGGAGSIPAGKAKLSIFLTDGPLDFQKVLVDIQSIDVKVDTCHHFGDPDDDNGEHHDGDHHDGDHDSASHCIVWTALQIHPGVYDLLKLRNGADTLLAASFVPKGKIIQVKITLGPKDSIMADSITRPLKIWDNQHFVVINIRNEHLDSIAPNNFQLILDFNLARSIRFENGIYWLKPELRAFAKKNTGEIEGKVRPEHSFGMIKAFNSTDTAYALPFEDEGEFKIRGLKQGVYSVLVNGKNGYKDSTIANVHVLVGKETDLGKIVLHK